MSDIFANLAHAIRKPVYWGNNNWSYGWPGYEGECLFGTIIIGPMGYEVNVYSGQWMFGPKDIQFTQVNTYSCQYLLVCNMGSLYTLDLFTSICGFLMYRMCSSHDIAKIMLKLALNTNKSINVYLWSMLSLKYHRYLWFL